MARWFGLKARHDFPVYFWSIEAAESVDEYMQGRNEPRDWVVELDLSDEVGATIVAVNARRQGQQTAAVTWGRSIRAVANWLNSLVAAESNRRFERANNQWQADREKIGEIPLLQNNYTGH